MKSNPQKYLGFGNLIPQQNPLKQPRTVWGGFFFRKPLAPENRVTIGFIEGLELCSKELARGIGP